MIDSDITVISQTMNFIEKILGKQIKKYNNFK